MFVSMFTTACTAGRDASTASTIKKTVSIVMLSYGPSYTNQPEQQWPRSHHKIEIEDQRHSILCTIGIEFDHHLR